MSQRARAARLLGGSRPPARVAVQLINYPETLTRIRLLKSTTIGAPGLPKGLELYPYHSTVKPSIDAQADLAAKDDHDRCAPPAPRV